LLREHHISTSQPTNQRNSTTDVHISLVSCSHGLHRCPALRPDGIGQSSFADTEEQRKKLSRVPLPTLRILCDLHYYHYHDHGVVGRPRNRNSDHSHSRGRSIIQRRRRRKRCGKERVVTAKVSRLFIVWSAVSTGSSSWSRRPGNYFHLGQPGRNRPQEEKSGHIQPDQPARPPNSSANTWVLLPTVAVQHLNGTECTLFLVSLLHVNPGPTDSGRLTVD
jgi:hypothetical protein